MNVLDAMAGWRSADAFRDRPPARSTIESILANAGMARTTGVEQPWRVHVFSDKALDRLCATAFGAGSAAASVSGAGTSGQRYDRVHFFGAPVGLLCTLPLRADVSAWRDAGGFVYAIVLAALEFGLATCVVDEYRGMDAALAELTPQLDSQVEQISVGVGLGYAVEGASAATPPRAGREAFTLFHTN